MVWIQISSVGPDLGPNCLQRLSADDKDRKELIVLIQCTVDMAHMPSKYGLGNAIDNKVQFSVGHDQMLHCYVASDLCLDWFSKPFSWAFRQ